MTTFPNAFYALVETCPELLARMNQLLLSPVNPASYAVGINREFKVHSASLDRDSSGTDGLLVSGSLRTHSGRGVHTGLFVTLEDLAELTTGDALWWSLANTIYTAANFVGAAMPREFSLLDDALSGNSEQFDRQDIFDAVRYELTTEPTEASRIRSTDVDRVMDRARQQELLGGSRTN